MRREHHADRIARDLEAQMHRLVKDLDVLAALGEKLRDARRLVVVLLRDDGDAVADPSLCPSARPRPARRAARSMPGTPLGTRGTRAGRDDDRVRRQRLDRGEARRRSASRTSTPERAPSRSPRSTLGLRSRRGRERSWRAAAGRRGACRARAASPCGPRMAATRAASVPARPPPTTTTRFGVVGRLVRAAPNAPRCR